MYLNEGDFFVKRMMTTIICTSLFLTACSSEKESEKSSENTTFKKAVEQGKLALAKGDVEDALASFELAENENPQDANTKKYVEQLQQVNHVDDLIEEKEYEQAVKKANQTMEKYTLFSPVQKELSDLKKTAESKQKEIKKETTKTNTTPKTQTTTIQTTPQKENLYASYMNKATLIGQNFDAAAYAIDGERQDSFDPMLKAFDTSYKQWDALLNEIYGTLKSRLSSSEFTVLRDVQRNWIKERDHNAGSASAYSEYAPEIAYTESLAASTRERCYALLEQYRETLR